PAPSRAAMFDHQRVSSADIWEYQQYDQFQVIYYFRPFTERDLQLRFEKMIEDRLQPGGVLIANHKNSDHIADDRRFSRLHPDLPVWSKAGTI
ncbi:MAG: class I SAM-dependent methyltransferase, partial [Desulfobulbaceae bacterium]